MKPKCFKISVILLTIFFVVTQSNAQVDEVWRKDFGSEILWQEVTSLGDLIVCTQTSLSKINPGNGEVIWENQDFGNISRNDYEQMSNSPFISINKGNAVYMLESFGGKVVFDSEKAGISKITSNYFLYKNNGILISGDKTESSDPIMLMVNISSGKINWKIEEKFGRIVSVNEPSDSEILVVTLFDNYKINSSNGEIIWKNANSAEAEQMEGMGALGGLMKSFAENVAEDMDFDIRYYEHPNKEVFYIGSGKENESSQGIVSYTNAYYAYDVNEGKRLWEKPLELNGNIGQVYFHNEGLIVLPDNGNRTKINMFDYKSQTGKWGKKGKGITIKGGIYSYVDTDEGILLVTSSGESNFLNLLDPTQGMLVFEKPVKIKGSVIGTVSTPKGVLYITGQEINILDNLGSLLLGKSIPTNPALTAIVDQKIYVFDTKENLVKSIDLNTAAVANLNSTPIKFEGKEKPKKIEVTENGIFINSDQNVALVSYDGEIIFNEYYPAPREPGLKRALMYAQAVRAAYIGANAYYASGVLSSAAHEVKEEDAVAGALVEGLGDMYGQLGDAATDFAKNAFKQASARFKATSEGRDFMIILTKDDKSNALIKVDKNSGKSSGRIDLGKEKKPEYAVDDITGQVFYKTSNSEISSYSFLK